MSSRFTDRFIHRPVMATVINLLVLLAGLIALQQLTVRQYPVGEMVVITINTSYVGADAALVQGFITTPLEREIASVDGIDYLESSSFQGGSSIVAHLRLHSDKNAALTQITSKINKVRDQLPLGSEDPTISVSSNESLNMMYWRFESDTLSLNQITDYIVREVQPRVESIPGVEQTVIRGARNMAMRIWLDPERMAAQGVTGSDIRQALTSNNFQAAVGATRGGAVSVNMSADTDLHTMEQFENLIVRKEKDSVIRLQHVADVILGAENYDTSVRINGKPSIMLGISVLPDADALQVIDKAQALYPSIEAQTPPGITTGVMYDKTRYMREAIDGVQNTLIEALVIVTAVMFLFLGSLRALLVPLVTIPLSLVGAAVFMLGLGYSINLLTMLGLVIAIGLVVDDAIIVAENIHRHMEMGSPVNTAALQGARELVTPVTAMTITLVAVYLPIGFIGGVTGSLFSEFAFTLAGAVLISGFVALTLSPMMCARLYQAPDENHNSLEAWLDRVFARLQNGYRWLLHKALNYVSLLSLFAVAVLASIWLMFNQAHRELAPIEDEGLIFVQSVAPPNTSPDQVFRYAETQGEAFLSHPDVNRLFQFNGGGSSFQASANQSFAGIILNHNDQREKSQNEVQVEIQQLANQLAGFKSAVFGRPPIPGAGKGVGIQLVLGTTEDPEILFEVTEEFVGVIKDAGQFVYVDSDLKFSLPQARVKVDRNKAADLGIDMRELGTELSVMLGGNYVNHFSTGGRSYKVIPQVDRRYRLNPDSLKQFRIRTTSDELVPLASVVSLNNEVMPQSLKRFQQLNAARISLVPAPGITIGDAIDYLNDLAASSLPRGFVVDYAGASRQFVREGASLTMAFGLALLVIYLVLCAQFESFRDPLIMLISVPMSVAGALLFIWLGFATLNIYTQIGLITLIGLISKHGILIVQFANQLQEEGIARREAVEQAASIRLRPILMTTAAMVLGVTPLVLASGAGAAARFDIGIVIASGMLIGTLFTLFIVPAMYTLIARDQKRVLATETEIAQAPQ